MPFTTTLAGIITSCAVSSLDKLPEPVIDTLPFAGVPAVAVDGLWRILSLRLAQLPTLVP